MANEQGKVEIKLNLDNSNLSKNIKSAQAEFQAIKTKISELQAVMKASGSSDALKSQISQLGIELAKSKVKIDQAKLAMSNFKETIANIKVEKLKSDLANVNEELANTGKGLSSFKAIMGGVFGGNLLTQGFNSITQSLKEFAKESSEVSMRFDALTNKFNAAAASVSVGTESFDYVKKLSKEMGLAFLETADAFSGFEAAALRSGLTMNQTKQIFTDVSTAVTSLQLSADRTGLVFRALEQISSKGVVSMEELKLQLGDSLPGALQIAARSMNMTTGEFIKLVSEGKVISEDFLPKFAAQIKKELGSSASEAARQARAEFNRFGNTMVGLKDTIGDVLNPALASMAKAITPFISAINESIRRFGVLSGLIKASGKEEKTSRLNLLKEDLKNLGDGYNRYQKMPIRDPRVTAQYESDIEKKAKEKAQLEKELAELNKNPAAGGDYTLGKASTGVDKSGKTVVSGSDAHSAIKSVQDELFNEKSLADARKFAESLGFEFGDAYYSTIVDFHSEYEKSMKEIGDINKEIQRKNAEELAKGEKTKNLQSLLSAQEIEDLKQKSIETIKLKYTNKFAEINKKQSDDEVKDKEKSLEILQKYEEDKYNLRKKYAQDDLTDLELKSRAELALSYMTDKEKLAKTVEVEQRRLAILKSTSSGSLEDTRAVMDQQVTVFEAQRAVMDDNLKYITGYFSEIGNSFQNNLSGLFKGGQDLGSFFKNLASDIKNAWMDMIASMITEFVKLQIIEPIYKNLFNGIGNSITGVASTTAKMSSSLTATTTIAPALVATITAAAAPLAAVTPIMEAAARATAKFAVSAAAASIAIVPILGAALAGPAATLTGSLIAAGITAAIAPMAAFADGGIVQGDYRQPVPIMAHGKEMVLNPSQQAELFNQLNGKGQSQGQGQNPMVTVINNIKAFDAKDVKQYLYDNAHAITSIYNDAIKNNKGGARYAVKNA